MCELPKLLITCFTAVGILIESWEIPEPEYGPSFSRPVSVDQWSAFRARGVKTGLKMTIPWIPLVVLIMVMVAGVTMQENTRKLYNGFQVKRYPLHHFFSSFDALEMLF